jgi:hypothetical protein
LRPVHTRVRPTFFWHSYTTGSIREHWAGLRHGNFCQTCCCHCEFYMSI